MNWRSLGWGLDEKRQEEPLWEPEGGSLKASVCLGKVRVSTLRQAFLWVSSGPDTKITLKPPDLFVLFSLFCTLKFR